MIIGVLFFHFAFCLFLIGAMIACDFDPLFSLSSLYFYLFPLLLLNFFLFFLFLKFLFLFLSHLISFFLYLGLIVFFILFEGEGARFCFPVPKASYS